MNENPSTTRFRANALGIGFGIVAAAFLGSGGTLFAQGGGGLGRSAEPRPSAPSPADLSAPSMPDPWGRLPASQLRSWLAENPPRRDYADLIVGSPSPAQSAWFERDRAQFAPLVVASKPEVIVVPVQVQGYGIDRTMRAMMTAAIVDALGDHVAPPVLVDRALGEGRRRSRGESARLASDTGARAVLEVFVGHDGDGRLLVSARIDRARAGGRTSETKNWSPVEWRVGDPPIDALRALVPAIVEFTGLAKPAPGRRSPSGSLSEWPPSPIELENWAQASARHRAWALALLAALAPADDERTRQRLLVQAYAELERIVPAVDADAFLKAWTLLRLGVRPAAVRITSVAADPELRALSEIADGNADAAAAAIAKLPQAHARFLLEIDLGELRALYALPFDPKLLLTVESLVRDRPDWLPLVAARIADYDLWTARAGPKAKSLLDLLFPLRDFDLAAVERGKAALGRPMTESDVLAASLEHVRRIRGGDQRFAACLVRSHCVTGALIDLLEARAISDGVISIRFAYEVQGDPAASQRLIREIDPVLAGHPAWELAVASTLFGISQRASGPESASAAAESLRRAKLAARLEQGQSRLSRNALALMATPTADSIPFLQGYGRDKPPRPYWPAISWSADPGDVSSDRLEALEYAEFDFGVLFDLTNVASLSAKPAEVRASVDRAIERRMRGNPARTAHLRSRIGTGAGDRAERLAATIRENPTDWNGYLALAEFHMRETGDYPAAERVLASFPDFAPGARVDSAVGLSNQAAVAGHPFFWRGDVDAARRFYGIASRTRTGSQQEMMASARIALLDGRYREYATQTLRRAERYDDAYAYRDYLSFLFVTGRSADAWAAFDQLIRSNRSPQHWLAADAGHRVAGREWSSIREWVLREPRRSGGVPFAPFPMIHAVMAGVVDRAPPPDLVATLRELEGRPRQVTETTPGQLSVPSEFGQSMIIKRAAFRQSERTKWRGDVLVPSYLVLFAEAYGEMHAGRYDEAVNRFDAMAEYYPIDGRDGGMIGVHGSVSVALPYFAWSAAKSGDKLGLERFLDELPAANRHFDQSLALAVFKALRGEHSSADALLTHALNRRPFTEYRPIPTEYQYAQTCEWLLRETGDDRYRVRLLDWARRYAMIQPMTAWPQALIAIHANDDAERVAALAVALFLDPLSERVKRAPPALVERARSAPDPRQRFRTDSPGRAAS